MTVAENAGQIKRLHDEILRKRKSLENSLKREMSQTLRGIAYDSVREMQVTGGSIPDLTKHQAEIESVLKRGYRRTSVAFDDTIRQKLNFDAPDSVDVDINRALQAYIAAETQSTSDLILQTTTKHFQDAVNDATNQGLSGSKFYSGVEKQLRALAKPRSETIAKTEVTKVSEKSKRIEALALNDNPEFNQQHGQLIARWATLISNTSREWHVEADGERETNGFFTVNGETLEHPGDTSHGASPNNIINCDCTLIYTLEKS